MIKFFRNIRKGLLAENRFNRYLVYAIGEIILVVIGILIALQINNWNEGRKQDIAEKEFVRGVKNDLQQDRDFILLVLDHNKNKLMAHEYLDEWSKNGNLNDRERADSLFLVYLSKGQRTFYPISGSFQSAVAGNKLNNFKDKETTSALIRLYNSTYSRLVDNARILDERWDFVSLKYVHERRTGKFKNRDIQYFSNAIDDMTYHILQLKYYTGQLENSLNEINVLLESN